MGSSEFINYIPPKEKGNFIYVYTYPDYQKYLYGYLIIKEIIILKPEYKFLFLTHNKTYNDNNKYCIENNIKTCVTSDELIENYKKCFVALRLTNHDGIANTVFELGLIGIKTIYNDIKSPTSLPYNSIEDIITHIDNEYSNKKIDYELIDNVKKYSDVKNLMFTNYFEKSKKKVIFASGDYPFFGGAATNIYALTKWFNSNNDFKAICIFNFQNNIEISKLDPDNTNNTYLITNWNNLDNIKHDILMLLEGEPELIYVKKWILGYYLKKIFPKCKIIYLLSSVISSEIIYKDTHVANDMIFDNNIPNCIKELTLTDQIITNSEISKNILLNYNNKTNVRVAYTSLIINKENRFKFINLNCKIDKTNWKNRIYDIGFVSSSCDRSVKNINLFINIINNNKIRNYKKVIIGSDSEKYVGINNCQYFGLLNHDELILKLMNTKLIIITSYYESMSNLMFEALYHGCNILIGKNIGGSEFIVDRCISNTFEDFVDKTLELVNTSVDCLKQNINYDEKQLISDLMPL